MKIIIVGAGKVGTALTQQLSAGNKVTVIDENPQLIENIINIYEPLDKKSIADPRHVRPGQPSGIRCREEGEGQSDFRQLLQDPDRGRCNT